MEALMAVGTYIVVHAVDLSGFVLPIFVDYLNKDVPDENERFIVSILVCFFWAVLFHWNQLMFGTFDHTVTSFSVIFLESQILFKLYFKTSFIRYQFLKLYMPEETPISPPTP